mgnify:CR=1 FL=1
MEIKLKYRIMINSINYKDIKITRGERLHELFYGFSLSFFDFFYQFISKFIDFFKINFSNKIGISSGELVLLSTALSDAQPTHNKNRQQRKAYHIRQ